MKEMIVRSQSEILLVGGGAVDPGLLDAALARTDVVVAADGAADTVLAAGRVPDAVIGDLDSLSDAARAAIPADRVHHIPAQDDTDFDKCLDRIAAPLIVGLGFLGKRIDHQLAAMSTLARHPQSPCILRGGGELICALPPDLSLDLAPGTRVSLFPMAPVTGRSQGLRWPIDGLEFSPAGRIGTSNEATGPVQIRMDHPGMLLILPAAAWASLRQAICAQPGSWPVRE